VDQREIDLAYAAIFTSPQGALVLADLRRRTIEQPCFTAGADPSHGFFREGQNSMVREIEQRLARARKPPEPPQPTE
jgi:hypothetical protein